MNRLAAREYVPHFRILVPESDVEDLIRGNTADKLGFPSGHLREEPPVKLARSGVPERRIVVQNRKSIFRIQGATAQVSDGGYAVQIEVRGCCVGGIQVALSANSILERIPNVRKCHPKICV